MSKGLPGFSQYKFCVLENSPVQQDDRVCMWIAILGYKGSNPVEAIACKLGLSTKECIGLEISIKHGKKIVQLQLLTSYPT